MRYARLHYTSLLYWQNAGAHERENTQNSPHSTHLGSVDLHLMERIHCDENVPHVRVNEILSIASLKLLCDCGLNNNNNKLSSGFDNVKCPLIAMWRLLQTPNCGDVTIWSLFYKDCLHTHGTSASSTELLYFSHIHLEGWMLISAGKYHWLYHGAHHLSDVMNCSKCYWCKAAPVQQLQLVLQHKCLLFTLYLLWLMSKGRYHTRFITGHSNCCDPIISCDNNKHLCNYLVYHQGLPHREPPRWRGRPPRLDRSGTSFGFLF